MPDRVAVMNFRVDEALKKTFDEICKQQDRSSSQVMRDLMRGYVREHVQGDLLATPKKRRRT